MSVRSETVPVVNPRTTWGGRVLFPPPRWAGSAYHVLAAAFSAKGMGWIWVRLAHPVFSEGAGAVVDRKRRWRREGMVGDG